MRPSRWDEWRAPAPMARERDIPGSAGRDIYGALASVIDPGQPEPVDVAISIERGRPVLMPLFPVGFFTPASPCPHYGLIPHGSSLCCMVCHQSGRDDHPGLKETAAEAIAVKNWKAPEGGDQWVEPRDVAEPVARKPQPKTRRERRARDTKQRAASG